MGRWEGMRSSWVLFAFALLGACRDKAAPERAVPEDAAVAPPRTTPDASVAAAGPSSTGPSKKLGTEPNLLDLVPAKVAVSSTVDNPRDVPEHLVDGDPRTAWNGKTGDLVGGWIAFRVPKDAHVTRVEMNAGYDKVNATTDLFRANHRITKVEVTRDGQKVGEHALDPEIRGLQAIPIDGPGGDYTIKVLATVPGTKKEWKELVVSELRVVGQPGKTLRGRDDELRVVVGSLERSASPFDPENTSEQHPLAADLGALCGDFMKKAAAELSAAEKSVREMYTTFTAQTPSCQEIPVNVPFTGDATYTKLRAVKVHDGIRGRTHLVVETSKGMAMTAATYDVDDPLDPGCPSIVRALGAPKKGRVESGWLVLDQVGSNGYIPFEDGGGMTTTARYATWCRVEGTKLTCRTWDAQYLGSLEPPWSLDASGRVHRQD